MVNLSNKSPEQIVDILLAKLQTTWTGLKWWQRLLLGGLYEEVKAILEALKKKGRL